MEQLCLFFEAVSLLLAINPLSLESHIQRVLCFYNYIKLPKVEALDLLLLNLSSTLLNSTLLELSQSISFFRTKILYALYWVITETGSTKDGLWFDILSQKSAILLIPSSPN